MKTALLLFIFPPFYALGQSYMNRIGNSSTDQNPSIAIDFQGNMIIVGEFLNTLDLNVSAAVNNVTSNGSYDIFISKYDDSSNYLWGFGLGGVSADHIESIDIDQNDNIFVTGNFSGFVDFDPSSSIVGFTAAGGDPDIFIAKYSPTGELIWVFPLGNDIESKGIDLVVDNQNNVLVIGEFSGTIDFDPSLNSTNLASTGGVDVCVAKYSNDGDIIWAFNVGGISNETSTGIDVFENGDFVITGRFANADFDPEPSSIANLSGQGVFVARYNSNGNYVWSFGIPLEGTSNDIKVDRNGDLILTGEFVSSVDFQTGSEVYTLTSNGAFDVFMVKYNNSRDVIWGYNLGSLGTDVGSSLSVDESNNILMTGRFTQVVDFDPSLNSNVLTSNGSNDIFLTKFSPNGSLRWAFGLGGPNADEGLAIESIDSKVYLAGTFAIAADFNIYESEALILTSAGLIDIFFGYYTDIDCLVDAAPPNITQIDSFTYTLLDTGIIIRIPSIVAADESSGVKNIKLYIDSVDTLYLSKLNSSTYGFDTSFVVPLGVTDFTYIYELRDSCDNIGRDTFYFHIVDNYAPELLHLEIIPLALDLSAGSQQLCILIEAKDSISGLDSATSINVFMSLSSDTNQTFFASRTSGDSSHGVYTLKIEVHDTTQVGFGIIDSLILTDRLSNKSTYSKSALTSMGFTSEFEISNFSNSISNMVLSEGLYLKGLDFGVKEKLINGDCYKISISNQGIIQSVNVSCVEGQSDAILESGNLLLDSPISELTLQSPNGSCWSIEVDDMGAISLTSKICPENQSLTIENGNLFVQGEGNGVILKSPDESCWVVKIASNNLAKAFKINCP